MEEKKLVVVAEVADPAVLPVLKSILNAADIPFLVQGEEAMSLLPVGQLSAFNKRGLAAAILVPPDRAEEAKALLAVDEEE